MNSLFKWVGFLAVAELKKKSKPSARRPTIKSLFGPYSLFLLQFIIQSDMIYFLPIQVSLYILSSLIHLSLSRCHKFKNLPPCRVLRYGAEARAAYGFWGLAQSLRYHPSLTVQIPCFRQLYERCICSLPASHPISYKMGLSKFTEDPSYYFL